MLQTKRENLLANITNPETEWDVIVIGGGATGLGTALDAGTRGYKTLLLEQSDFAKGTSSRSTKLVHGGVRYLAQGDIGLVKEALYERGLLLKNAAHLVKNIPFIIPVYSRWKSAFYTIGLKLYDLLAGKLSFGPSKRISKAEAIKRLPGLNPKGLNGGVLYHDGQFDDSRLAINLAQTCLDHGVTVLNYFRVTALLKENGRISGLMAKDVETSKIYQLKSKAVVNATGVFVDEVIQMDEPNKKPLVKPSQGIHIVVDRSFMPGEDALMIPETDDGRVLFVVPWHGKLLIGTTDTPLNEHSLEPVALEEEIGFVMRTAGKYLSKPLTRKDVRSVFAGLRPLAAPAEGSGSTKEISRSHKLIISTSGLVTITGLAAAMCVTKEISIHGNSNQTAKEDCLSVYGNDRIGLLELLKENPEWLEKLHPHFNYVRGQVIWAARNEMARTVEDVLARRLRALFLDSRAAVEAAPIVARLMAKELKHNTAWQNAQVADFTAVAEGYMLMGH
jgi:glycerol-3-phosphate dehydrogenase